MAVALLIKDSYLFNSLRVAPHQHRQGCIKLFIGSCCCRVNDVCYKKCTTLRHQSQGQDIHGFAFAVKMLIAAHVLAATVSYCIFNFQALSLLPRHHTVAFLYFILSSVTLQCFPGASTFIAWCSPAGEGMHRDAGAFLISLLGRGSLQHCSVSRSVTVAV